jgi:adenylyltransferase/sulfurtransferase
MSSQPLPLEIDCRSVSDKLRGGAGDFVLVDCREQDEYDLVHIDGAVLVPMSQLAARVAELGPYRDREIAVYCHHGGRSLQVIAWLRTQGFARARSMAGGIDQWAAAIDPSLPRY